MRPRRPAAPLSLAAAVAGLAILGIAAFIFVGSAGFGYDFEAYHAAARRILEGDRLYDPGTASAYAAGEYDGLYLYPPPVAVAFVPMALLPIEPAAVLWLVMRVVVLAAGCAVLPVSRGVRLGVFAVGSISFPVLFDLNLGNVSIVLFALVALAWREQDRRWVSPALHVALAALRPPMALFGVLWLVQRDWGRVARTAAAGLAVIALSVPIVGVGAFVDYGSILRSLPDISTGPHNLSLKTTVMAMGLPALGGVANLLALVIAVAAVAVAGTRRDRDAAFVTTFMASLAAAPFLHPHYLVGLLIPAAYLASRGWTLALLLPLAGWLPGVVLPVVVLVVLLLVLALPANDARVKPTPDPFGSPQPATR